MILKEKFPGIQENIEIAPFTAYKIGGKADLYIEVTVAEDIPKLIEAAKKEGIPYYFFGGGCNTVFSDKGFRGLLIHNLAKGIEVRGSKVIVASGVPLSLVIAEALRHKLGGIDKLFGLPGTIGGAIYGNAGAQGVEIGDFVESAKIYNPEKGIIEEQKEYFQFSYRTSILKQTQEIVLEVILDLPTLDPNDATIDVLKFRAEKQPKGNTAGSFFKNPTGSEAAGFLIDKAELKGTREGDIEISELHGNWLINKGKGTQKDLIKLARKIKDKVEEEFGVTLEPENILIDEFGNKIEI